MAPAWVTDVELTSPLPDVPLDRYKGADFLVRLHGRPVGRLLLSAPPTLGSLEDELSSAYGETLEAHLRRDECQTASVPGVPACRSDYARAARSGPTISVVVSTRDRSTVLEQCVDSLLDVEYHSYEIIVVDNAPQTDSTAGMIGTRYGGNNKVRYVREDRVGLSPARNRGAREARGEIVAFIDDDAVADREWLGWIAAAFALRQDVACVTGLLAPYELETGAQVLIERFGFYNKGYERQMFNGTDLRPSNPVFPYAAGMFGTGGNLAFRADFFASAGGFDLALGRGTPANGGEDLDMFFRTIMGGQTLVYEPAAVARHQHRRELPALQLLFGESGLGAYLTKTFVTHPGGIGALVRRVPAGVAYFLAPGSGKAAQRSAALPLRVVLAEWQGLMLGPWRYLQGRRLQSREDSHGV